MGILSRNNEILGVVVLNSPAIGLETIARGRCDWPIVAQLEK